MRKFIFISITILLTGCYGKLSDNYRANLDGRNIALIECAKLDRNTVTLNDSGGNPITISHAAGHCYNQPAPVNETSAALSATASIAGAAIGAAGIIYQARESRKASEFSDQTSLAITQSNNARVINVEATRQETTGALVTSLTDTLNQLTTNQATTAAANTAASDTATESDATTEAEQ